MRFRFAVKFSPMSLYQKRGVSAQKEEVHAATQHLSKGLYEKAFCKLFPDYLGHDKDWVNVMHADGAGTKSILAYLYWKDSGDLSVWKKTAQDAIVMNLDDLLCVGIYDNILFSSTIDRNKHLIPGEVLKSIIDGSREFFERMNDYGIQIQFMGGETADVGDVTRTIAVNGTMTARWPLKKIITNEKISAGNVIVGLAGFGQAKYEDAYNSGIASNGLTSARHDMLQKTYGARFPESFDTALEEEVVYIGPYEFSDTVPDGDEKRIISDLLLSPTRTFAPLMREICMNHFDAVNGLVHCSGGGQTKCLKFIPDNVRIIKDNLFEPPVVFKLIQQAGKADDKEMYQVFNMGTRMEIYTNEKDADKLIAIAKDFGIDAQVIGRVEESEKKELEIKTATTKLIY